MSDVITDLQRPGSAAHRYSPRPLTDGEQWTAGALSELRRGGYRPHAWRSFLQSSLKRSRTTGASRPSLARQGRRWGAYGALAWLLTCRASRDIKSVELRVLPGLAWWLATWQMLDWHLGMAEGGDGQPRAQLSPADAVSLARFWLIPTVPAVARSSTGLPAVIALAGANRLARRRAGPTRRPHAARQRSGHHRGPRVPCHRSALSPRHRPDHAARFSRASRPLHNRGRARARRGLRPGAATSHPGPTLGSATADSRTSDQHRRATPGRHRTAAPRLPHPAALHRPAPLASITHARGIDPTREDGRLIGCRATPRSWLTLLELRP